jgi:membrane-associated phospholipid phosphatase
VDWRLYHWVNGISRHHTWLAHAFNAVETVGVVLIAVAACALWLLARPGGSPRWKLAAASALGAAALGLLVNQLIAKAWDRPRPFATHPGAYTLSHSHDPSFPSDHATAAFAIAVAILLRSRRAGWVALAMAIVVSVSRVIVGTHYPSDVLGGALIGTLAALVLWLPAVRAPLHALADWASRLYEKLAAWAFDRRFGSAHS